MQFWILRILNFECDLMLDLREGSVAPSAWGPCELRLVMRAQAVRFDCWHGKRTTQMALSFFCAK